MKKALLAFTVSGVLLSAVSGAAAHTIRDAKAEDVANCTFLTDVSAPTKNKKHTRTAVGTAMDAARKDAHRAGATDIVWDPVTSDSVTNVTGKAYKCTK